MPKPEHSRAMYHLSTVLIAFTMIESLDPITYEKNLKQMRIQERFVVALGQKNCLVTFTFM